MKKVNFIKSNLKSNEMKRALVESIQKNSCCIDYLQNTISTCEDLAKYTEARKDAIEVEMLQWILFNMKYNTQQFEKTLKQLGGNPDAIGSFEWK